MKKKILAVLERQNKEAEAVNIISRVWVVFFFFFDNQHITLHKLEIYKVLF